MRMEASEEIDIKEEPLDIIENIPWSGPSELVGHEGGGGNPSPTHV